MAMQNVFNILVDLKVAKTIPQPLVTQNDSVVFILEVMDNGVPFDLAETTTISLAHTRKDQSVVVTTGTKVGNIVTFVLGTNETAVGGSVTAKAQFYDATGRVSTLSFSYQVGLDPTGAGYVPSEVEQTLIQVVMADAQAKIDELSAVDVVELSQQLADKAEYTYVDGEIAKKANGAPKGVYSTFANLQTAYPTGDSNNYIVVGNIAEIASLNITAIPSSIGNVTVTLNGVAKTVAVDPAIETTTNAVATKIRSNTFTGWVTGGTGTTITFTANTTGVKTDSTYNAGTTGSTGTMSTTTQGVDSDGKWYYWNGSAWVAGAIYQSAGIASYSITTSKMADKAIIPENTSFFEISKNLFNKDKMTDKTLLNDSDGVLVTTGVDSYYTSDFIRVKIGEVITLSSMIRIVFYNENKVFNNGYRQTIGVHTFTSTINGYFRFSAHNSVPASALQVENGNAVTTYEPYYARIKTESLGETLQGQLSLLEQPVTPERTSFFEFSKNVFNPDTSEEGYYLSHLTGGQLVLANYVTSDYIEMKKDQAISLNMAYTIIYYDVDKVFKSGVKQASNLPYTFTKTYDGFVRFSFSKSVLPINSVQAEYNSQNTSFEQYYVRVQDKHIDNTNQLTRKTLMNFGDSIASAETVGERGYHVIISDKYEMKLVNHARNGATVTVVEGSTNNLKNQIDTAIASGIIPDYVLFDGHRNDISLPSETVGVITDGYGGVLDTATFCGAFEYYCKTMRENWLGSKIVYIRTHNSSTVVGAKQIMLGELALDICRKYATPFVDLFSEGGINTNLTGMKGLYTLTEADGTHPNTLGYATFYVPQIEAKMKAI